MWNEVITWGLVAYLVALVYARIRNSAKQSHGKITPKHAVWALTLWIVWCIYIFILSKSGVIRTFELPPRLPLMAIIPALILIGVILSRPISRNFLKYTPLYWLIAFQWFRIIVEFIIYRAYLTGILPEAVTFDGSNYDIWVGISALPVALLAKNGKLSNRILIAWNITGILVLTNTVRVFLVTVFFSGREMPDLGLEFTDSPYVYIAAFFMPMAMLAHGLSIKQLLLLKEKGD